MDAVLINKCPTTSTTVVLPLPPLEDCGQSAKTKLPMPGEGGQCSQPPGGAKQGNVLARKVIEEMRSLSRVTAQTNGTDAAEREGFFFFFSVPSAAAKSGGGSLMLHSFVCFFAVEDIAAKLHQIAQPTRGSVHVSAQLGITLSTRLYRGAPGCNGCHWCSRARRLWVPLCHDDCAWILHVLAVSVGSQWGFQLSHTDGWKPQSKY